jgi:hypothetical protein
MIVDAQVDGDIRQPGVAAVALDDQQRRGLLAPAVAACRLRSTETREQPPREP